MKVSGSTIQQLEKDKPKSKCRKWRLWATTDQGRKSKRFTGTYTQAQNALEAWVSELSDTIPNSETFGAYAESWRLWRAEAAELSPNTTSSDAVMVRMLRRTELESMRMDEITPGKCRDALLWLKSHPQKGGEYKASTLGIAHQVLNAIFSQAVDDGKLAQNPMRSVPRPKHRPVERDALSPEELALFLNRLDDAPLDGKVMALYLMACLGLRCGEACAMRDDHVGNCAVVDSTVRSADGSIGRPKSESGKRKLPVPPRLSAKVAEWRGMKKRLGIDSEYLCCNIGGDYLTPHTVTSWWARERAGFGCDGMTLHQLRHSNLSMMARHMSPFDLQRYAGWSSIEPAKIYVHGDMDAMSRGVSDAWSGIERTKNAPMAV